MWCDKRHRVTWVGTTLLFLKDVVSVIVQRKPMVWKYANKVEIRQLVRFPVTECRRSVQLFRTKNDWSMDSSKRMCQVDWFLKFPSLESALFMFLPWRWIFDLSSSIENLPRSWIPFLLVKILSAVRSERPQPWIAIIKFISNKKLLALPLIYQMISTVWNFSTTF